MKNIFVYVAHPDDEHGMSGTIRHLATLGHTVFVIVTVDGKLNGEVRRQEMQESAKILGVEKVLFLGEVDGELEFTKNTRDKLKNLLSELPVPDAVFTMSSTDVHPDHAITSVLVMGEHIKRGDNTPLLTYALNSSGRAYSFIRPQTLSFFPTHYFPVDNYFEIIKEADAKHISQDPEGMWKGVEANLIGRAKRVSEILGKNISYAEGFVNLTRLGELPAWLNFLIADTDLPPRIPFPVSEESIGVVSGKKD